MKPPRANFPSTARCRKRRHEASSGRTLPPSQVKPDISPDLEAIILKAMDKNPYNRFQTARDMKQALDDFLMGRP